MTATDELRAMLTERGLEYDVRDGRAIKNTYWDDAEGRRWGYTSDESGVIKDRQLFLVRGRMDITPEQAIAATLGAGTCRWEPADFITEGEWWNTECGGSFTWEPDGTPNYCPNCGRKVVDE